MKLKTTYKGAEMKAQEMQETTSKNELFETLELQDNLPIYIELIDKVKLERDFKTGFDEFVESEGTLLPIQSIGWSDEYITISVDNTQPKPLDESIDTEKFRKELMEYFGFADRVGTHIWEQTGDYTNTKNPPIKKIKKSFVNEIITVLDSCRKGL